MSMNIIKPFDIVISNYVDLTGAVKSFSSGRPQKALFMVIAVDNGNVIACKITSQNTVYNNPDFTYSLLKDSHSFLMADSHIQLTKPHTLFTNCCTKIGEVALFCRPAILNKLKLLFNTLTDVVSVECPMRPSYSSPNNSSKEHTFAGIKIKR